MNVRLIQPAQLDANGQPRKHKQLFFPNLGLPTVAALTPAGIDVGITIEYVDDIDFDEKVDLVGVTAQTCQAPRAYQIADEFRRRGRKTIMGGIHAEACTEEALGHFDAVLVGEAEDIWPEILADVTRGQLKRIYQTSVKPDLQTLAIPRYDLLDYRKYVVPPFARTPLIPIQATRGCPHRCDFCSVSRFWGNRIRTKPVGHVVREIEALSPSRVFFADDNIGADPAFAHQLFAALEPMKLRWACQMSTTIGRHPDLIAAAARAGCHETLMGIESIKRESLQQMHKGFNNADDYKTLFRRLADAGILVQASIILGIDGETAEDMAHTLDAVLEWDVNYLYIGILTPFPGTALHSRLTREGRIRNQDWSAYDVTQTVFEPIGMTANQVTDMAWSIYDRFYASHRILARAWHFRGPYVRTFPRNNVIEEVFFQFQIQKAVNRRQHPFALGSAASS